MQLPPWFWFGLVILLAWGNVGLLQKLSTNHLSAEWALLAAMKTGGKASVVAPFAALSPIVVVSLAPLVLHESIAVLQGVWIVCALVTVALLSTESTAS